MNFTLDSFFNPHLALGATRIDAVLTATASGDVTTSEAGKRAVAFVIDVSGSMDGDKITAAKYAVRRCIDLLDERTLFTVIAFSSQALVLRPMGPATYEAKNLAHLSVQKLEADGGTEMSKGLLAARQEFIRAGQVIAYALFLTDGENNSGDRLPLKEALQRCQGVFQCDCRGVGVDWEPKELRLISGELLGSADAVAEPDRLESDFKASLARALSKGMGDVRLRLWTPKTARVLFIKQMSPEIVELTSQTKRLDDKTLDVPLGAWGAESRDYHIAIEVEGGMEGDEMLACRPSLVFMVDGVETKAAGQPVVATWTADEALSTRINPQVAHYTGQEELADSIREGLDAKARGDIDQATKMLGKAAKIAIASGNDEVTQRLKKVVDVIDADAGTVRLKSGAGKAEVLELDMGGTRTVRRRPPSSQS